MVEIINLDTSPSRCVSKMGGYGDDSIQQSTLLEHTAVPAEESPLEASAKAGRLNNAGNRLGSFGITTENSEIHGSEAESCEALVNSRKVEHERTKDEVDDPSGTKGAGKSQSEKNNERSLVERRVLEHNMQHDAEASRRELKVPRQLMFQPIRTNGRLILQLKWRENEEQEEDAEHEKLPVKSNVEKTDQDCQSEATATVTVTQDRNPTVVEAYASPSVELYGESNALKELS